jgi:hypothetical protein
MLKNLGSIRLIHGLDDCTDGDKRYEIRIASDLKKSGSIRFVAQRASFFTEEEIKTSFHYFSLIFWHIIKVH